MAAKKRTLEDTDAQPKAKKARVAASEGSEKAQRKPPKPAAPPPAEEIDFPRGGGSSFTPAEHKAIRHEAALEAEDELRFEDSQATKKSKSKPRVEKKTKKTKRDAKDGGEDAREKSDTIRVEHLNYKRLTPGMRVLCQVTQILPLGLVVSLPNQLLGNIPITHISKELTARLEAMEEAMDEDDNDEDSSDAGPSSGIPELPDIFRVGQYVTAVVSTVHAAGTSVDPMLKRPDVDRSSHRVELSLVPEEVNEGVSKRDLGPGFILASTIKSVEDHGYVLNFGIPEATGFLSFKDAKNGQHGLNAKKLPIGMALQVCITKKSDNGRIYTVSIEPATVSAGLLSEVSSVSSVLPGTLVDALITAVLPTGLNLQLMGFFEGTIDQYHLGLGDVVGRFKLGDKIKARVIYEVTHSSPKRFALSALPHVVSLHGATAGSSALYDAFPMGTVLDAIKVVRVEPERGLLCQIQDGIAAFVHISQVSDEHVNTLSATAGTWKVGTVHRARVTGFFGLDGLVQVSLRQSILDQKFMHVSDVTVGERMKGTVKRLADNALFVSVSGSVDAVVWPNHYADITLRHPEKRFKAGGTVKGRVLVVDPERNRLCLTLKKTLVESDLPIVSKIEEATPGTITHAVVFKNLDKGLLVEFFNNLRAFVPQREMNDSAVQSADDFPIGKVVRVKILDVNAETSKIVASIRQGALNFQSAIDISGVDDGAVVHGTVAALHKEHAMLSLVPSKVRALLSFANLAKHRNLPLAQAKAALKVGEGLKELTVVGRNAEKGFVLVGYKDEKRARRLSLSANSGLAIDKVTVGQVMPGLVVSHGRKGAVVRISSKISGSVHALDVADELPPKAQLPPVGTMTQFAVLAVDKDRKQLTLSSRPSNVSPESAGEVKDREINSLGDLKVGQRLRGFIKSVADHGLFVNIGRNLDARVQIKELFDDFVKDWKSKFNVDDRVHGQIISVDVEKNQVEMSLRSGDRKVAQVETKGLADFAKGQKVDAIVKRTETYGIFLQIEGTKISGLCHKSNISDTKDADVERAIKNFKEGDRVKAMILSIDLEKRRIDFGLKPSFFDAEDFAPPASDDEDEDEDEAVSEAGDQDEAATGSEADEAAAVNGASGSEDDDDEVVRMDGEDVVMEDTPAAPIASTSALQLGGFNWTGRTADFADGADAPSSSDEGSDADPDFKRKKKKRKHEIEYDRTAEMHKRAPESTADFERLLLSSPNSSYLWVQYMSFQLQLSETEKAREVGRRALKVINFREEQEKLNVWIALLNLENLHGTPESLAGLFKDAARHNDSKTIHLRMAAIFDQTGKLEQAEEQFQKTCKKFGKSSKVWTEFGEFYLRHGKPEDARKLLSRCIQSLEKRKHLKTISKFAQLEYKLGDPERGRTIFEGIVNSHPKRFDLWFVYLDMEAGQKNIGALRNLFDRVLSMKMSNHKAKAFFKKWLDLEKRIGDEQGQNAVKEKAIQWTQKATAVID
ncbi:nucleic acid-binding protein [Auricularia subglabra TFB-10046 SS5]|nr:nucleic acid-binding protein [Auricularia subglabra TFB-10046 SS5]